MFQKVSKSSFLYKAMLLAFIVIVLLKLVLRITQTYSYMDLIDTTLYVVLFLTFCFGIWDINKRKKENQK
ncbi:hypothetical protein COL17_25175 [Priestia megaterium]|nr:hypothetical protein COL17_25175 [Priestia megaterium]